MQDRLLNAYLAGTVDEGVYKAKSSELRIETSGAEGSLAKVAASGPDTGPRALSLYDWSQNAARIWQGSNTAIRREILDSICLNRTLSDVKLVTTKRKPFDVFAERPNNGFSRGERIFTEPKIGFATEDLRAA